MWNRTLFGKIKEKTKLISSKTLIKQFKITTYLTQICSVEIHLKQLTLSCPQRLQIKSVFNSFGNNVILGTTASLV